MSKKKCIIKVFAEEDGDDINVTVQNMEEPGYEGITREIFKSLLAILYNGGDRNDNS